MKSAIASSQLTSTAEKPNQNKLLIEVLDERIATAKAKVEMMKQRHREELRQAEAELQSHLDRKERIPDEVQSLRAVDFFSLWSGVTGWPFNQ